MCRDLAWAAIGEFLFAARVVGFRHAELSEEEEAAMAALFERLDRSAGR
jgi:hypothetical protein